MKITNLNHLLFLLIILGIAACQPAAPKEEVKEDAATIKARMLARADSLELDTPYEAPPGDPLSHHTSGYAKVV